MNKRQPVGIKDMCMYLCKFLKDESRYGDISNKNKRLYKIANQYINQDINQENDKDINTLKNKYKANMGFGFIESEILEKIMNEILIEEEKKEALEKKEELMRQKYLRSIDINSLSLVDAYAYYYYKKQTIYNILQQTNNEIDFIHNQNDKAIYRCQFIKARKRYNK